MVDTIFNMIFSQLIYNYFQEDASPIAITCHLVCNSKTKSNNTFKYHHNELKHYIVISSLYLDEYYFTTVLTHSQQKCVYRHIHIKITDILLHITIKMHKI